MKVFARVLLGLIALVALAVLFCLWRASGARTANRDYHAAIPKTVLLTSESFATGTEIPASLTCKGAGSSPQLSWTEAPPSTQSYVLIMMDWDGPSPYVRLGSFTHWILYDIPAGTTEIKAAVTPAELHRINISLGRNSNDGTNYTPPCPPMGAHRYVFTVYALDSASLHPDSPDRQGILNAMKGHILAFGELDGHFGGPT